MKKFTQVLITCLGIYFIITGEPIIENALPHLV